MSEKKKGMRFGDDESHAVVVGALRDALGRSDESVLIVSNLVQTRVKDLSDRTLIAVRSELADGLKGPAAKDGTLTGQESRTVWTKTDRTVRDELTRRGYK
jgi:hypothetical protein